MKKLRWFNQVSEKRGFTLVELLVVVIIIGIIASITMISISSVRSKGRDIKRISDIRQVQLALDFYKQDENAYPSYLTPGNSLVSVSGTKTYLKVIPSNPAPMTDGACLSGSQYSYAKIDDNDYALNYCLAAKVNDIGPGDCQARPNNLCKQLPGASFTQTTPSGGTATWSKVAFTSDGSKIFATQNSQIYWSTNGGQTWTAGGATSGYGEPSMTISSDGTKIAFSSWTQKVRTSTNSGASFTQQPNSPANDQYGIAGSADGQKLAVLNGQQVWTSEDGGVNWTNRNWPAHNYTSICMSADGQKIFAANRNGVYYSHDGGLSYSTSTISNTDSASIDCTPDGRIVIVGDTYSRVVKKSSDYGVTFSTLQQMGPGDNLMSVSLSNDGTIMAAAIANGYLYLSYDSGQTWSAKTAAGSRNWRSVEISPDGSRLVAGTNSGYVYISP